MTDLEKISAVASLPCIACGGATDGTYGRWTPTDACIRDDLGIEPPGEPLHLLYPCCPACARRAGDSTAFIENIEDRVIARFRAALRRSRRPARAGGSRPAPIV